jgi:Na+-transporting NADH:ubiquinone oxidoreductase subunit NqrB
LIFGSNLFESVKRAMSMPMSILGRTTPVSFMKKLILCGLAIGLLFFAAEIISIPPWARIACYYGMLAVALYGVWMVWKSSAPPPDEAGK